MSAATRPVDRAAAELGDTEASALRLIAAGHTSGEMAELMYLSQDGAKSVQKRLYRKLGARERANAVHIAHMRGLLGGAS